MAARELSVRFLTSSEVADLLGVGVSSIKRWTDGGELSTVRTPGGHRRYTPEAVRQFAASRSLRVDLPEKLAPAIESFDEVQARESLVQALVRGAEREAEAVIRAFTALNIDRALFLDRVVGGAMKMIGDRWADRTLGVECEHRGSYMLASILDRMRDPGGERVARSTLACPPGEQHDLPLRMVRLILEWEGWETDYLGADVPFEAATQAARERHSDVMFMSSPIADSFQTNEFLSFATSLSRRGLRVAVGGAWARGGTERRGGGVLRFRSLSGLQRWLRSENEQVRITRRRRARAPLT
jgi:excisionase family DNA binding protein